MNFSEVVRAEERIRSQVRRTPVERSTFLSSARAEVWLKLEHLQETGSFKWRGALHKMAAMSDAELARGVVTASNGNHGMAVCAAGALHGIRPQVYLREEVSAERVRLIRDLGGDPCRFGRTPLDAEREARRRATERGQVFISPYNDAEVVAGQGTIGLELAVQLPRLDRLFVAVGGGGLISGIGVALRTLRPSVRLVGCWPVRSAAMAKSLEAGRIVEVEEQPTLSESTAGGVEEGSLTFPLCQSVIDERILVSEEEIRRAMWLIAEHERWMVEGAAAVAVAGYLRWRAEREAEQSEASVTARQEEKETIGILLCGRNISPAHFFDACRGGAVW
ncbi:MAG: threonine/serine dehydratase [Blastocatellia bacterium]|jgi:threonine dehydratase